MNGDFGRHDPREMPAHFFYRSLRIEYGSAVRADPGGRTAPSARGIGMWTRPSRATAAITNLRSAPSNSGSGTKSTDSGLTRFQNTVWSAGETFAS